MPSELSEAAAVHVDPTLVPWWCSVGDKRLEDGATILIQAGHPPRVNGQVEEWMRVGCGSATIGMFAKQRHGRVDEVVVVDGHIIGVLSEHQAGKLLGIPEIGIRLNPRDRHSPQSPRSAFASMAGGPPQACGTPAARTLPSPALAPHAGNLD